MVPRGLTNPACWEHPRYVLRSILSHEALGEQLVVSLTAW